MIFKSESVIGIFILSCCCYVAHINALDISAISSFVSPKVLKCYKCSSLLSDDCKNLTNASHTNQMIDECMPGAQGCVKQWVKRFDGKNATFRECYYGSISYWYTNFQCEGLKRDRLYDVVQCHKCRGNLCNNGNRLYSTLGILFSTLLMCVNYFVLRM